MKKRNSLVLLSLLLAGWHLPAETTRLLHEGWRLESACKTQAGGEAISKAGFSTEGWVATAVPSTVLAAQVNAGIFPDPYFGDNLRKIPGAMFSPDGRGEIFANKPMPEGSPYRCGWWYRSEFKAPEAGKDRRVWLHFGGINYRAELWLNGHRFADTTEVAGAYRTYDFDVTEWILPGQQNVLAAETFAPSEVSLGINWVDWNPCPADKDMGLWGEVRLSETGAVTVRSPQAVTHFRAGSLETAELTVYAELHNAADHAVKGTVTAVAAGARVEQSVELAAHEDRTVAFSPAGFPALALKNPELWWPWQMGKAHLEKLTVRFSAAGQEAEEASTDFGIREVTSELTSNGSRLFRINGKPILIRGAGWSQDMLLRTTDERLRDQVRLVRAMNLNTIRLEGKLETEEFFRLTDREGILVLLGWCCCDHWEHWKDWTAEDLNIATASLRSQMLRLRQHASLLVWLNGSDNPPPANVESAYLKVEEETHWPNPTLSSASQTPTTVTGTSGVKMTGPYDYVAPSYWYVDKQNGGAYGFNTETSPGPAIPSLASRRKFLPDPEAWPPSPFWSHHNGGGKFTRLEAFDGAMKAVYAEPHSAAEYERLASTLEYDSERAMYEAYSKNKYDSTGVIQWMLNNAWPSMIWHLYDYYLDAGAGYFATRKACEPVHIQYSYDDRTIVVVNSLYEPARGLKAQVHVHNLAWKEVYASEATLDAGPDSTQRVFEIPEGLYADADRIFFIDLALTDAQGRQVSRNFYWVPGTLTTFDWPKTDYTHTPALRHEDLTALASLPKTTLTAHAETSQTGHGNQVRLKLKNGDALAFQVHAAVRTLDGGLIAPVFWNDNWIELTPGEETTLTAELPEGAPEKLELQVDGWNFAPTALHLTLEPAH